MMQVRPGVPRLSAVQCSAVQCSAVQCSAAQRSAAHCSAAQCSAAQRSAVQMSYGPHTTGSTQTALFECITATSNSDGSSEIDADGVLRRFRTSNSEEAPRPGAAAAMAEVGARVVTHPG